MRVALAADPVAQSKIVSAAVAASSGTAWWALAQDLAVQLLGVPLQVALAAAFGAFLMRTYLGSSGIVRTLGAGLGWTFAGAFSAPLVAHYAGGLPHEYLPGVALFAAAGGQMLLPWVVKEGPGLMKGWLTARGIIKEDPPK